MYCNKCVLSLGSCNFSWDINFKEYIPHVSSVTHNKQIWLNTLCLSYIAEMSF